MSNTIQRGSGWSIALVFNLYKLFGYTFIYYLMYPVTFFYFVFAWNVKIALRDYYKHIDRPFNNRIYFHHLRHFAICMCDRFISKVSPQSYRFDYGDQRTHHSFHETLYKGGLVVMSHFGGWTTGGNCFTDYPMSIIMQEVMLEEIKKIENSITSHQTNSNLKVIDLSKDGIKATIDIANALINNELVGMMADRTTIAKHYKEITFFNQKAHFNKNPFEIAYKTEKPLIAVFVIYQRPQVYKQELIVITMDKTKPQEEEVRRAMETYAKKLEAVVSKNPEQWFNFYNFWKEEK